VKKLLVALPVFALVLGACNVQPSADDKQRRQTEQLMQQATNEIGMPGIVNFREKRMLKMLYELRDQEISTYTYVKAIDNSLTFLCNSVGYGMPGATQYTSPKKVVYDGNRYTMPQAEPNGLFMPTHTDASWIMCVDPAEGRAKPVYVEDHLLVSPFPLKAERGTYVTTPAPEPKAAKARN
jgi:hypothetical protein